MRIVQVTVDHKLVVSLPDYCNVSPALRLVAEVEYGEDVDDAIGVLSAQARAYCQEIVDDELEAAGQSPRYYDGPLFYLYYWEQRPAYAVVPQEMDIGDFPGTWRKRGLNAQRWATVISRAFSNAREIGGTVLELLDHESCVEALEWWDAAGFYRLVYVQQDPYAGRAEKLFIVRDGVDMVRLTPRSGFRVDNSPRLLEAIEARIQETDYAGPVIVIESQDELDREVDLWFAEHPDSDEDEEPF